MRREANPCDIAPSSSRLVQADIMFKHILVPVDGSTIAMQAARSAIRFAQAVKARLTVIHVIHVYPYAGFGGAMPKVSPSIWRRPMQPLPKPSPVFAPKLRLRGCRLNHASPRSNTIWRGVVEAADPPAQT